MKTTTNYGLKKPEGTDAVDIADFNENADIIDNELAKKIDRTGAVSDMTVNFTQSGNRVNLTPGEKISTAFGKISKFFVDLKTVAFSGNYNDLTNRPTIPSGGAASYGVANNCTTNVPGYVLDAQQGKNLQDQVNMVNSNLNVGNLAFDYVVNEGLYYNVKVGADTVRKKCSKELVTLTSLSSNITRSVSCVSIGGYKKMTINNFIFIVQGASSSDSDIGATNISSNLTIPAMTYDSNTGLLTVYKMVYSDKQDNRNKWNYLNYNICYIA